MEDRYAERPWRRLQDLVGLPETLTYPETSYTAFYLDEPARKYPDNLAVVYMDYEMSFRELKDSVDRLATALSDREIKKGDVVATVMVSSPQFVIADLAIPRIGAIHAPMSILDSAADLRDKFNLVRPKAVICTHSNIEERDILDRVKEVAGESGVGDIIVTKAEDYSSSPPAHEAEEGIVWFTDLISGYPPQPPEVEIDIKKDVAMVLFTGGTTGTAKACMYPHFSLIGTAVNTYANIMPPWLAPLVEGLLRMVVPLPLFHVFGHNAAIPQLSHGHAILLQKDPRDHHETLRLVKKYRPLMGMGVPTQFMRLAREEGAGDIRLLGLSSGAPLHQDTARDYKERAKAEVGQVFGPTEVGGTGTLIAMADLYRASMGGYEGVEMMFSALKKALEIPGVEVFMRLLMEAIGPDNVGQALTKMAAMSAPAAPAEPESKEKAKGVSIGIVNVDCEIKITDLESGEKIPLSRVVKEKRSGELWMKGPGRMSGFWPTPGSGIDDEGFIRTGDVATVDELGHVYIVDRVKDMAVVSGFNVYTGEIDKLLFSYPGVAEVATIGVPDPEKPGSERIKVFIVPQPEYKGKITEGEIIEYLKGKVAPYAVPQSVEFRGSDEFPRTTADMDKIAKRKLKEEEIEKMERKGR
jgi:acyl-CoA synthetase (AMP-forming)/AMP-acid ligase II